MHLPERGQMLAGEKRKTVLRNKVCAVCAVPLPDLSFDCVGVEHIPQGLCC